MKKSTVLLAAAVLAAALSACVPPAPAPSGSAAQSVSSAPDVSSVPGVPAQSAPSQASSAPAADPARQMAQALDACVCFGPGEAGSSLKAAIAACALLDSAQDLAASQEEWAAGFDAWYQGQEQEKQELFWENWPGLAELVEHLGPDPSAEQGLLESAGSPNRRDHYDAEAYRPMLQAIGARQP